MILIDTIGELGAVWGLADVAFVGGSLSPGRGGQNMMEPAAYGAAVLFGPHTSNFREAVERLLSRNAARRVADAHDLACGFKKTWTTPRTPPPAARRAGNSSWPSTGPRAARSSSWTVSSNHRSPKRRLDRGLWFA